YRAEVARQQTTYNQPSYTSFYLASDLDWAEVPVPDYWPSGGVGALRERLDSFVDSGDVRGPVVMQLANALRQAERDLEKERFGHAARDLERFLSHLERAG